MNMKETQQVMENNKMLSLFDYLGHPAGSNLGKQVAAVANKLKVPINIREVETKTYKGKILLYPKSFLDVYFNKKKESNSSNKTESKLPF